MKTERLTLQEALERGRALPWSLARSLSSVTLGPTPEGVELEELIEARFFDAREEVRLFRNEAGLQAVRLTQEDGDVTIETVRKLANPKFGRAIMVVQTLDFDGDGQAFVACTRLAGWKGELEDVQ